MEKFSQGVDNKKHMKNIETQIKISFEKERDPANALKQKAYMKEHFPFLGIKTPKRREIQKELFKRYPFENESHLTKTILKLWGWEEREYQYAALDLADKHFKLFSDSSIALFEELIRTKSWWDTVDDLAVNCVGRFLKKDLTLMDSWLADPYLWIRRSALICQIKKRDKTDEERLFKYCLTCAHEKDFFIRKAIGWALREYAKARSDRVRTFLAANQHLLSGLSLREASKHLI